MASVLMREDEILKLSFIPELSGLDLLPEPALSAAFSGHPSRFLLAALFGAFGGTLGMFAFRHKTKHWYFRIFFPLLMLLQAGVIGYLWSRGVF